MMEGISGGREASETVASVAAIDRRRNSSAGGGTCCLDLKEVILFWFEGREGFKMDQSSWLLFLTITVLGNVIAKR